MDAFLGYNQITTDPTDQKKTTFITEEGLYCYKVMLFSLKNTKATYQRLVNKVFFDKFNRTMEVYVNDMLVKSPNIQQLICDLAYIFSTLREYGMKLNPKKCIFMVETRKFLGFMVS